jgi:hypothetical protein
VSNHDRKLTIEEANDIARGWAEVSVDPEDPTLWRVEGPGRVEAHEPMSLSEWTAFLCDWTDADHDGSGTGEGERWRPEHHDEDPDPTDEAAIETLLCELLLDDELAPQIERVETFEEAGLLTTDRGVVIHTHDRRSYQVTIVRSR